MKSAVSVGRKKQTKFLQRAPQGLLHVQLLFHLAARLAEPGTLVRKASFAGLLTLMPIGCPLDLSAMAPLQESKVTTKAQVSIALCRWHPGRAPHLPPRFPGIAARLGTRIYGG